MKKLLNKHSVFILTFPYVILFILFIVLPVAASVFLSFTQFNTIEFPKWIGLKNYMQLFTNDQIFMQKVLPNTVVYSLFVGIGGYILGFYLAWSLAQVTKRVRTILTVIIYSPSMTGGVLLTTVWGVIFNGDKSGYLNYALTKLNIIEQPIAWLQSDKYLLPIMILVALWSSMGVGFLAILSGILNVNTELYEAGYIDGIKNRFQEIIYITIPSSKPQMLFGAIMAIVNTFSSSGVGTALSGSNPTPNYAGQLIATHIEDYGFLRYEMGYAAAVSIIMILGIKLMSNGAQKLFGSSDE